MPEKIIGKYTENIIFDQESYELIEERQQDGVMYRIYRGANHVGRHEGDSGTHVYAPVWNNH
jgi:hypothetical protein